MLEHLKLSAHEPVLAADLFALMESLPVALAIGTFPEGRFRFVNKAFTRLFGYENGHFATIGQWLAEVYDTDEERAAIADRRAVVLEGEHGPGGEIGAHEYRVRCRDGSYRFVLNRETILRDVGIGMATFEDITDRKLIEEEMQRHSLHDVLTGLPNRRGLRDWWCRMAATGNPMAVGILDLDRFKPINDRYGHGVGDEVLKEVADRLRATAGRGNFVGRLGGDEFVLLFAGADEGRLPVLLDRLIDDLANVKVASGPTVELGASLGISYYPRHATELADLMRLADQALYNRKRTRLGGWEIA